MPALTLRQWTRIIKAAARGKLGVEGWNRYFPMDRKESVHDASVKEVLLDSRLEAPHRYKVLAQYLIAGFVRYATAGWERVFYPGMGSHFGPEISGLEGFARTAPLIAAWIYSKRVIADRMSDGTYDLISILKSGLLAGTNSRQPSYWGHIGNGDQRTVETADIARVLLLTRKQIWERLEQPEQQQLAAWLLQVNSVSIPDNNWLLFPVVVNFVLDALGYTDNQDGIAFSWNNYYKFKKCYLESGWFFDNPEGVDYYNTWGITYDLFWIYKLRPNFDKEFIEDALAQSAFLTSHLIGPWGIPIMGRSIIYRTAIPVPVLAASFIDTSKRAQGLARRALDATWRYFVANGCLRNGALTQGYFGSDPRLVDRYSGPGSAHWGLRSLVLAFMHAEGSAFWTVPDEPLPVEIADYRLEFAKLGWVIEGRKCDGRITIRIAGNRKAAVRPENYSLAARIFEYVRKKPVRPHNHALKYECAEYRSDDPLNLGLRLGSDS